MSKSPTEFYDPINNAKGVLSLTIAENNLSINIQ